MQTRFDNQVVWITGGGSGIGEALAYEFGKQGASVAISGRRSERLDAVVRRLQASGTEALAIPCDVTDEPAVLSAVRTIIDHFGRLDVAVANAGFGVTGGVETHDLDTWRRQFEVNVFGAATTVRAALPALKATQGRLVLVASIASLIYYPKGGLYAASKAALRAMGLTLSLELSGSGVSCTTIHPGFVESEIGQVDNAGRFDSSRRDMRPEALMWTAERAAKVMVNAIFKRRREFVFTWHGLALTWLARHVPWLTHLVASGRFVTARTRELEKVRRDTDE